MKKNVGAYIFCILLVPYFISSCLMSCRTTKASAIIKTLYDSTAIKEVQRLNSVLKSTEEKQLKEKEQWESAGVVFDTQPCPDTSKPATVTKIIFDNGRLQSIQGNVKALNQSMYQKTSELNNAYTTIDSMGVELEKAKAHVSKEEIIKVKHTVRKVYPLWLYVLCLVAGAIAENRLNFFARIKRIFSLIKI